MRNRSEFFLIAVALLSANAAVAAEVNESQNTGASETRNHDEDWYWGFNLGGGSIRYKDGSVEQAADSIRNLPSVNHATVYFDLHFLWPLEGYKTALGVSAGGVADAYTQDATDTELDITASLLAFSAHHYLSSNIGDGLFLRGDIGLAGTKATNRVRNVKTESDTERGLGLRLGIGYSILLSNETRLPLMAQWQYAGTGNGSGSNAVVFSAGLLF